MSPKPLLTRRQYQCLAIVALLPAGWLVWRLGPFCGAFISSWFPNLRVLTAVLGYALTALAVTLVWVLAMLPLRARSEMGTLRNDWDRVQKRGGPRQMVHDERSRLDADGASSSPRRRGRYFLRMALGGALLSAILVLVSVTTWLEGLTSLELLVATAASVVLTGWWLTRFALVRARDRLPGAR